MRELPGVLGRIADEVGEDAAHRLGRVFAGCAVKFPSLRTIENTKRDRRIRSQFNGSNAGQLAKRFGISRRRVYQIVGGKDG